MKKLLIFSFLTLGLILQSCSKKESVDVNPYYGNFDFKIICNSWQMIAEPHTSSDTSYYSGQIVAFNLSDLDNDLFPGNADTTENADEKITIIFGKNLKITTVLNSSGVFLEKNGYHYNHTGNFITQDSIAFTISGLGGMGGGSSFIVTGVRKK